MEGKRAAAIVALCMLMLLSGQQQVTATPAFCACYKDCYGTCRRSSPRWICLPLCVINCAPLNRPGTPPTSVAAPTSVADCSKICMLIHICGWAATDTSGAATCVDDCTKNQSQYTKHH